MMGGKDMNSPAGADHGSFVRRIGAGSDVVLRFVVTLLVLAFPAATLFINHGDSYTLGLLMMIGIWVWLRDGARVWLTRDSSYLCLAFVLLFAVAVLAYVAGLQTESGFHFLGRYLRFLLIVPVYLAFRRYPPTAKTVFIGLALGVLTAGVLASLEFLHAHGPIRVAAQTDLSIIFGDLTTTMVLCTVAGFGLMSASRALWSVPLLTLCIAAGVAATLLSGTRGAWIPLLLLPLALMTPLGGFLRHRYVFAIILVLVAMFTSSYLIARSGTNERLTDAGRSLRNYFTALEIFGDSRKQPLVQPNCLSERRFLSAWVGAGHPAGGQRPEIKLVADTTLRDIHSTGAVCYSDYALRIHNPDSNNAVQFIFPRASLDPGGAQHTSLLVRGIGVITFAGSLDRGVSINTPAKYMVVSVTSHKAPGSEINVFVGPNNTLWLVPRDNYTGEYSFSIANTSVGQRLELWRAAWRLFLNHPWLGIGTGAFRMDMQKLINAGVIAPFVGIYDHPHNDYLDALSSRGLLGFAALLVILLLPTGRFLQAIRSPVRATHAVGMAGVLTVAGFAIYALTDTIFLHSMMITWYVIYIALFYSLLDAHAGSQAQPKQAA